MGEVRLLSRADAGAACTLVFGAYGNSVPRAKLGAHVRTLNAVRGFQGECRRRGGSCADRQRCPGRVSWLASRRLCERMFC